MLGLIVLKHVHFTPTLVGESKVNCLLFLFCCLIRDRPRHKIEDLQAVLIIEHQPLCGSCGPRQPRTPWFFFTEKYLPVTTNCHASSWSQGSEATLRPMNQQSSSGVKMVAGFQQELSKCALLDSYSFRRSCCCYIDLSNNSPILSSSFSLSSGSLPNTTQGENNHHP